jgi:Flp pilus assembly protein TadD
MIKYIIVLALFLSALFTCGFDWTFGLVKDKCAQAKKIAVGLAATKDDLKRSQNEKHILDLCPAGAPGHYVKALNLEREGNLEEAIFEYQESIKDDPQFPEANGKLGLAYMQTGKQEEAAVELTKAAAVISDPLYHKALAKIFNDKKMFALAFFHYNEALKGLPGDASLHIGLAEIYAKQKNTEKAEDEFRQAIALESGNESARLGLSKLYLETNNLGKALDELKKAQVANPQNKETHRLLGENLRKNGDLKTAEYEYQLAGINRSVEPMEQLRK